MKIKIGNIKISLKDFIKAVLDNTDNKLIKFNCKDADYLASVKFKIKKNES